MTGSRLPRVVLLVDHANWAFDFVARALSARLASRFDLRIVRRAIEPVRLDPESVDLLYVFFWGDSSYQTLGFPPEKIVKEVASWRWALDDRFGRLTPERFAATYLADCATVTTPSRTLYSALRGVHPRVLHVPNGVDTRRFRPRRRSGDTLRIGWVGNPKDDIKGLDDVLRPACEGRFALAASDGRRSQRELVRLYQGADVVAIASLAESQPLPLLEGMACGCFPVTTDVGIVPELVRNGVNGLVVSRTPDAFRAAFEWCERNLATVRRAGAFNAELVREERDWDLLAARFGDVLDAALGRAALPAPEPPVSHGPARAALASGAVPARAENPTPWQAATQTLRRLARGAIARRPRALVRSDGADERSRRHALVGPGHLWQMKRAFQIEFLRKAGLAPQHRLLDLGCGTLRGGIPLIEYLEAGHYTGIEVRADALAEGRRELAEHGLDARRPDLHLCTNLAELELAERFDFAWAFSVLIHMDDAAIATALAFVARHLAESGALFANVNLGSAPERRWFEFPVVTRDLSRYEELAHDAGLQVSPLGALHDLGHVSGDALADAQVMLRFAAR